MHFRARPKTVARWASTGRVGCIRTAGGHRRFPESEIRALLATVAAPAGSAARVADSLGWTTRTSHGSASKAERDPTQTRASEGKPFPARSLGAATCRARGGFSCNGRQR